jgi:ribosomal protein L11 methylase PrmA
MFLIELSKKIYSHTKINGRIGLSGIILQQAETVIKEYSKYFSDVKIENIENDWVLITAVKIK